MLRIEVYGVLYYIPKKVLMAPGTRLPLILK